ncbi:MAG: polyamine aminopropyltransferase [Candidatus Acididesulfobacter guangdongensis]|uniref:Polyamine aminopropyltransferase n=1 Tax=Acididesulfobacter guangdongensis TaxID=2597225 RepID=A0A519BGH7_ACIG2|nr:MAG: polyamine aminopropyltransferase [Candidatus Acididesulfobacter guangdongensis]
MEAWFFENQTGNFGIKIRIKSVLYHENSDFQEITVYDTYEFGKMLVLDNAVMFTDSNEFIYHEMLSFIPIFAHAKPENILIIGGGDGGIIRECLKNNFVKHIDLVEIDNEVIKVSKKFFPQIAYQIDNEKVSVKLEDGIKYLKTVNNMYDVIIIDSTDPVGPAEGLFTEDFYYSAYNALKDDGIFAAQTESPFFNKKLIKDINQIIDNLYKISMMYYAMIPVYPSGLWSFTVGSKKYQPNKINEVYKDIDLSSLNLKYYSPEVHGASFILPKFIKELLN